ncbi:MBL fold metallo-hydrolase [Caballeronia sp. BCC1704]|uniref:MBL fold metallo-hydrolase n=1 Tax=Caballeronia sp. BCC1704 TaxID=2676300 RepID=UPI001589DCA5|nr:MBL fold metallo-hydrolase [Caballeronia sp. BCC1704]
MKFPLMTGVFASVIYCAGAQAISLGAFENERLPMFAGDTPPGTITVTYLGTTTLLFDDGTTQILVDAFLSRLPITKVRFARIKTDRKEVIRILKEVRADRVKGIFVTHSHYDHAFDAGVIAQWTKAPLYGTESTRYIGLGAKLRDDQIKLFAPRQPVKLGEFEVTPIPSKHSPPFPFVNDNLGEKICAPLPQPQRERAYVEGGTYNLLITHRGHRILVVPSANYERGALHCVHAEVVFLSIGAIGTRSIDYHQRYYDNVIGCTRPSLVIPVHWDNFFVPLSKKLPALPGANVTLRYIRERLRSDNVRLGVVQGEQKVKLFDETSAVDVYQGPGPGCEKRQ